MFAQTIAGAPRAGAAEAVKPLGRPRIEPEDDDGDLPLFGLADQSELSEAALARLKDEASENRKAASDLEAAKEQSSADRVKTEQAKLAYYRARLAALELAVNLALARLDRRQAMEIALEAADILHRIEEVMKTLADLGADAGPAPKSQAAAMPMTMPQPPPPTPAPTAQATAPPPPAVAAQPAGAAEPQPPGAQPAGDPRLDRYRQAADALRRPDDKRRRQAEAAQDEALGLMTRAMKIIRRAAEVWGQEPEERHAYGWLTRDAQARVSLGLVSRGGLLI